MTNRQIAGLMRRHGLTKNPYSLARNSTSWRHPEHPRQLVTVGKVGPMGPPFLVTGPLLTLAVPATLSEEKAVECLVQGLDLYQAESFAVLLGRVLDWFDIQAEDTQGATNSL